jgi:hypothetical protein
VAVGRGDAAPFACATSEHVEDEAQRRFGSFNSAVEQDLLAQGHTPTWRECDRRRLLLFAILAATSLTSEAGTNLRLPESVTSQRAEGGPSCHSRGPTPKAESLTREAGKRKA